MKKIIFYALFALIATLLSLLIIKPMLTNRALLSNTGKQNVGNTSGWKTYQFDKQYKDAALHFRLSYPQEWQPKEKTESVMWYSAEEQEMFTVSWLNPDFIYDVESICRSGMCDKVSEVSTSQNNTIEIWRPTSERQKALSLPDTFLWGEIVNSSKRIIPEFSTVALSVKDFETILATFSFTD